MRFRVVSENCLFSIIKQLTRKPSLLLLSSDSHLLHINNLISFPPSSQKKYSYNNHTIVYHIIFVINVYSICQFTLYTWQISRSLSSQCLHYQLSRRSLSFNAPNWKGICQHSNRSMHKTQKQQRFELQSLSFSPVTFPIKCPASVFWAPACWTISVTSLLVHRIKVWITVIEHSLYAF